MPGANYFLSKLATQTPGPLVGDVSPKTPLVSCMDLVPVQSLKPSTEIVQSSLNTYNTCRQVAVIPPKEISVIGNKFPRPVVKQFPYGAASISLLSKGYLSCQLPITAKGLEENPVGELQELCTKMRWVFPSYSVCCENGQPHERTFVVVVRLYHLREKGEAKSKKAAKREAARCLLVQLLERAGAGATATPSGARQVPGQGQGWAQGQGQAPVWGQGQGQGWGHELVPRLPKRTHQHHSQHSQHHPQPWSYDQYQHHEESESSPNVAYIDMLQDLAGRRNFRAIYLRLDSKTVSGLVQVMLQVSTCPVIVVRGQGRTVLAAKADAALNALECIRITSKKTHLQMVHFAPS